jgi:hypothetical protein
MNALHLIALGPLLAIQALAQITAPAPAPVTQRDPQALSLLSQSLAAMTKGTPIQDIKLQAQATRTAGSETDTGSAVLEAAAYDKSNTNLALTSGPRLEIRNGTAGVWSAASAQNQPIAMHNTWTAAAWFAPVLVIQPWIQDSSFSLGYAGLENRNGSQVHHIHAARIVAGATDIATLSGTDLYLDPQSLLPVALAFNTHPDNDLRVNLPVEVTFGTYQTSSAMLMPSRIQNFLQNSLLLDLSVTATSANNGLAASDFLVP